MLGLEQGRRILQPGDRFGRLVIQSIGPCDSRGSSRWACRCDCGNSKVATGADLRRGFVVSCGCQHREAVRRNGLANGQDLTGRRFERLVVVRRVDSPNRAATMWECRCDCGNPVSCYGSNLRRGGNKSCGCGKAKVKGLGKSDPAIVNSLLEIPDRAMAQVLRNANLLGPEFRQAKRDASIATLKLALNRMRGKTRTLWVLKRLDQLEQAIDNPQTIWNNRQKENY
jgi:hypothetical protein